MYITNFGGDAVKSSDAVNKFETFSHNMEWMMEGVLNCIRDAVGQNKPFFVALQPTIPNGDQIQHAMFDFSIRNTPNGTLDHDPV